MRGQDRGAGGSDGLPLFAGVVEDVCVMETWNPEKAASWNQAPKLQYRLDYDRQKAELFVTRLEGRRLADFRGLPCVRLRWTGCAGGTGAPVAGGSAAAGFALCHKQTRKCGMPRTGVFLSLSDSPKGRSGVGGHPSSGW